MENEYKLTAYSLQKRYETVRECVWFTFHFKAKSMELAVAYALSLPYDWSIVTRFEVRMKP